MKNGQEQNFNFARGITLDTRVTGFKTNLFSIAIIQKFFYSIESVFASRLNLPGRAGVSTTDTSESSHIKFVSENAENQFYRTKSGLSMVLKTAGG